ncbi:MAG: DUF99 family protein [Candidatus Undinarchaeales archaeon]
MAKSFRTIKEEIRILGIDDAPFKEKGVGKTLIVGTVFRAGEWLDGVLSREIKVDGMDVTNKIVEMINSSRHNDQLRVIMLDGITFGGMNSADISEIHEETGLPVIVVNRKKPNFKRIKKALEYFKDKEERWNCIESAGKVSKVKVNDHELYIQIKGIEEKDAREILELSCTRSKIPEPLRAAHLIAAGVTDGESRGRA